MPEEIANAIASGSATRPTVTPATTSAANWWPEYLAKGEEGRGKEPAVQRKRGTGTVCHW